MFRIQRDGEELKKPDSASSELVYGITSLPAERTSTEHLSAFNRGTLEHRLLQTLHPLYHLQRGCLQVTYQTRARQQCAVSQHHDRPYQPILSDWHNFEAWSDDGSADATAQPHRIYKELLNNFIPPPFDAAQVEAINRFIALRQERSGALMT